MPDTTVLPTGGTSSSGGGINWLLVGGAGVGIVILLMMFRKSDGGAGQPTVAAGASINAALGSIQEQNLNLMGQLGQTSAQLGTQISGVSSQVQAGNDALTGSIAAGNQAQQKQGAAWYDAMMSALSSYFSNLSAQVGGVSGQVTGVSSQVGAVGSQLGGVSSEISANDASLTAELQRLFQSIPAPNATTQFNGVNLSNYRYVWYQPQGADTGHAAIWQINNGIAQGISWAQYVAQTGLQAFPGVGGAPRNPQYLVMA